MNKESTSRSFVALVTPEVRELIEKKDWQTLREVIKEWEPPDIADLLTEIEMPGRVMLFRLLPRELQSVVLSYFEPNIQEEILLKLTDKKVKELLEELDPDDRTKLFEDLHPKLTRRLINMLSPGERKGALTLLGYPEDSVGRLMTPDYVAIKSFWTIEKALEHVREYGKDAETINMIYVVDKEWHLVDDIPIRRLILADPSQEVEDIMDHHFVSISAYADQEEAIKLIQKYDLPALPVVDNEGHLLGIVTVDDIIDALQEEHTEDFAKFAGVETEPVGPEFITKIKDVPLSMIFRSRITWLLALLFMDLITGGIIQGFENMIAKYVVLVTFLPVLVDTAGNAGAQAATLVIRALAVGTVTLKDWANLLLREFAVSAALGVVMGLGISIMGFIRGGSAHIAEVVVAAMIVNVIVGSLIGVLLPFIFAKFKKDPATASTPLITTLSDIIGTAIYLGIASMML